MVTLGQNLIRVVPSPTFFFSEIQKSTRINIRQIKSLYLYRVTIPDIIHICYLFIFIFYYIIYVTESILIYLKKFENESFFAQKNKQIHFFFLF